MIKNAKQHKSCLRVQYSKETGTSEVQTATLSMLRASSLLITSGATLAEQKVHWMRSFEDIWKRIGVGAEALEPIVLDAEWYLDTQVRINPDKLLEALGFPAGDYVIRRSTPADRLLVQILPNLVLKTQHIQQLCQQLLYVQEEFSEVRFDIIEAADAETLGDKLSRDAGSSASYLETKPDALVSEEQPAESTAQPVVPTQPTQPAAESAPVVPAPAESVPTPNPTESPIANPQPAQPTEPSASDLIGTPSEDGSYEPPPPPARNAPDIFETNPEAWKGIARPDSDYYNSFLDRMGYTRTVDNPPTIKYGGKRPFQEINGEQHDALGFKVDSEGNIEV